MKLRFPQWCLLLAAASLAAPLSLRAQTTFANPSPIPINDSATPPTTATLYPSNILVSGLGSIDKITVTLLGLNHTFPDDLDILLVGPQGQNIIIFSDVGGSNPLGMSFDITLDDDAALNVPNTGPLVSGTYKPTDVSPGTGTEGFPPPAPALSGATTLSTFNGTDPNGTWSLYVVDDEPGDFGSITNGWRLTITAEAIPEPSTWILFSAGLLGVIALRCLRRRSRTV